MEEKVKEIFISIMQSMSASGQALLLSLAESEDAEMEIVENFAQAIKEKFASKVIQFNDKSRRCMSYSYIIQFRPDMQLDGSPVIILNDFQLGLKGDKNPVIHEVLIYDDIDKRDEDMEKLHFLLH